MDDTQPPFPPALAEVAPPLTFRNGHRLPPANSFDTQFRGERARLAGIASAKARAAKRYENQVAAEPPPTPQPKSPLPTVDPFVAKTISQLRVAVKALQCQLMEELGRHEATAKCSCGSVVTLPLPDSKRLKELSDAVKRNADLEREWSGRPLPGSKRPPVERVGRRPSSLPEPEVL